MLLEARNLTPKQFLSKYTTFVTFVALVFVLGILTKGSAMTWTSIRTLIVAEAVRGFVSLGIGMIIITWGIDLSIGYVVCLTASVAASFAQIPTYESALYYGKDFPIWLPLVAAVAAGGLFGLLNGVLVAYGRMHPFVATLGTQLLARGVQLIYTKARIVGGLKQEFKDIAQGSLGPIPLLGVYLLIAALIIWVLLKHTKLGTNFYAIGGNQQAARVSGINVEHGLVAVYTIAGILYGLAGMLMASRLGLANALTATEMTMDGIAAVTVGGVSQTGGVGTVPGMMLGVFTMGLINYGMSYLGIDSYYQLLVKGAIIIIAVYFDMRKYAKRA
jgi:methyl-galactoside transport system permease protein